MVKTETRKKNEKKKKDAKFNEWRRGCSDGSGISTVNDLKKKKRIKKGA